MTTTAAIHPPPLLSAPATRRLLVRYVARRVPACDVDDVVQATLCDALASGRAPRQDADLHRFLLSIARFKVVDAHRAAARSGDGDAAEVAVEAAPHEARSLLRWAEEQLPDASASPATLRWMLREAEGDKLEVIAADEALPAARVRQRVSRLRRWLRERWTAELALAAALAIGCIYWAAPRSYEAIFPEPGMHAAEPGPDPRLQGTYRLVSYQPAVALSAGRRALLDKLSSSLTATFDGRELHGVAGQGSFDRRYAVSLAAGGRIEAIDVGTGGPVSATYAWEGDELVLTVASGPWAGVSRLRQVR